MKTKHLVLASCLVLAALSVSACGLATNNSGQPSETQNGDFTDILAAQSTLKKFSNPAEMKEYFAKRPAAGSSVMAQDASGRGAKDMAASTPSVAPAAPLGSPEAISARPGGFGGGAGANFSTTNTQVEGVDEADIVKTDGTYIYSASEQNIIITKAVPAAGMSIVSTIKLDSRPQELYVKGDKLIVFGYANQQVMAANDKMATSLIWPQSSFTFVAAYDISDPAAPKLIRRLELEGNYLSSRLIDKRLYFITANYNFSPMGDGTPLPRVMENGKIISGDQTTDAYRYPDVYYIDTPSALNATTVTVFDLDRLSAPAASQVYLMPTGETVYASADNLYLAYTKYLSEYQLRMAIARDLLAPRLDARQRQLLEQIAAIDPAIMNDDEKLYKVNQVIEAYVAKLSADDQARLNKELEEEFNRRHPNIGKELEKTVVHKISLADGHLEYKGSGEVTGRLLNQYSLDEFEGHLRIATTRQRNWFMPFMFGRTAVMDFAPTQTESYSNIYILNGDLKTVGQIEDMAKGESIYAVRFMGARGYLVTFRQVDPLFVIDLAVPEKPAVLGQLKVPGFSNYLHPYNDTIMIGIGKEAIDKGDQGVEVGGLKASLFDVSVPDQPKEISSITLGGRGSDSSALYDYKAVMFSKEKGILTLPASITPKNNTDYRPEFQGILVLNVGADKISERGRVVFRLPDQMTKDNAYFDDNARRALYIADNLYSYSAATLKANRLSDLRAVSSLDLPRPEPVANPVKPMPYETSVPAQR